MTEPSPPRARPPLTQRLRRVALRALTWTLLRVYGLIVRFAVAIVLTAGVLYFAVAAQPVKEVIERFVAGAIPGTITAATVRLGPAPWEIHITEARIHGARGEEIIRAEAVRVKLDILSTIGALVGFVVDSSSNPLPLHVEHVDVLNPRVLIEIDEDGAVGLVDAFDAPGPPSDPGQRLRFDIRVASASVRGATGVVAIPGLTLEGSQVDADSDFSLLGEGVIAFRPTRVRVGQASLALHTLGHLPGDLSLAAHGVDVEGFRWQGERFRWDRASGSLGALGARAAGRFEASGGMDVGARPPRWFGRGEADLSEDGAIVAVLTAGALRGPVSASLSGRGDIDRVDASFRVISDSLSLGPIHLDGVSLAGAFEHREDPELPNVHAVRIDALSARLGGGTLRADTLRWEPTPRASGRDVSARWEVEGLDPTRVPGLGDALAGFGLAGSRVDGEGVLALTHDGPMRQLHLGLAPLTLTGAAFSLDAPIEAEGDLLLIDGPAPLLSDLEATSRLDLHGLEVTRGADRLSLGGSLDLARQTLDLVPEVKVGDLRSLTAGLLPTRLRGAVSLTDMALVGPFRDPSARARLTWRGAAIDHEELREVQGGLTFAGGWLSLHELRSTNDLGGFRLDGALQLLDGGALSRRMPFRIERARVQRLELHRFTDLLGGRARADINAQDLEGDLRALGSTARGRAEIRITQAEVADEPVQRLQVSVALTPELVNLRQIQVELDAGPVWTGQLQLNRRSEAIRGVASIAPTSLASLAQLRLNAPQLSGLVQAELNLSGTLEGPVIMGTVGVVDLAWDRILLGSAALNVTTMRRGLVEISSLDQGFFRGLELRGASLQLRGFIPQRLQAQIGMTGLAPADFIEAMRSEQLRLTLTSELGLDIDLVRGRTAFRLEAPAGGLKLAAPLRNMAWDNRSPLLVTSDGQRIELLGVSIGQRGHEVAPLEVCGYLTPGRGMDFRVAGAIDLGLIPGIDEAMSSAEGSLRIAEGPETGRPDTGSCFFMPVPQLYITGSPERPRIDGAFTPRGVAFMPRGSGRGVRLVDDGRVELWPGDGLGAFEVRIPEESPLAGELDDGTFRLSGRLGVHAFRPRDADLSFVGSELFLQSAGEFTLTASPTLRITASGLDAEPDVLVAGRIDVSEGRFFKSFDALSEAIGGAFSGRGDVYSRSIFDAIPWLGSARLDLDVLAEDFQIQTALPLARADLPVRFDLSVRGTVARPSLFRRIDLLLGGSLSYFVFERAFRVVQGAIDFDGPVAEPVIDITAQTPVAYLARASTDTLDEEEREVMVTLRVIGRVPDLKIEFSADDASLDQADIQSLLLTGKPRGDLDRAQESSVVSADLSSIINSVLSAPFVRTASVGVGQKGAMEYRVGTCFASNLCFDTTTIADDTETTMRARFSLLLGDNLVCEGTLRRSDAATMTNQQTYQARCRYRIPLR